MHEFPHGLFVEIFPPVNEQSNGHSPFLQLQRLQFRAKKMHLPFPSARLSIVLSIAIPRIGFVPIATDFTIYNSRKVRGIDDWNNDKPGLSRTRDTGIRVFEDEARLDIEPTAEQEIWVRRWFMALHIISEHHSLEALENSGSAKNRFHIEPCGASHEPEPVALERMQQLNCCFMDGRYADAHISHDFVAKCDLFFHSQKQKRVFDKLAQCGDHLRLLDATANFAVPIPGKRNAPRLQYLCPCSPVESFRIRNYAIVIEYECADAALMGQLDVPSIPEERKTKGACSFGIYSGTLA